MSSTDLFGLSYVAVSDPGVRRELNEDSAYAGPYLLAVADGMGGHAHGEVASATAIGVMAELGSQLATAYDPREHDLLDTGAGSVTEVRDRLDGLAQQDGELAGMGTTLTALLIAGGRAVLAHIGDSRGYLLREGVLHQITHDHTLVQALIDEGRMPAEQAALHPRRSMLTKALQTGNSSTPDVREIDVRAGDRLLLCSDGLTAVLSDEALCGQLAAIADLSELGRRLVELANEGGGPDNITCVLADVVGGVVPAAEAVIVGSAGAITG